MHVSRGPKAGRTSMRPEELLSQWHAAQAFPLALVAIFNAPGDLHHPMAQASDSGVNFKSTCGVKYKLP